MTRLQAGSIRHNLTFRWESDGQVILTELHPTPNTEAQNLASRAVQNPSANLGRGKVADGETG